jgi:L-arabinose transport system ATP-binding protein
MVKLGGYMVESNSGHIGDDIDPRAGEDPSLYGYRASVESARFSKHVAKQIYGREPDYSYVWGGSGGGRRSPGCLENSGGVYDGALPFMGGGSVAPQGSNIRVRSEQPISFGSMFNVQRLLRDGKLVAVRNCAETSESELVSLMVGRELVRRFDHETHTQPQIVMQVEGLTTERVRDITFQLHKGEVLGFAGLVGAGRTDLAKALFGADRIMRGKVVVKGKALALRDPQQAIRAGIGFTPEDRKKEALVLSRSVRENIALVVLRSISRLRFVRRGTEQAMVQELVDSLRVKTPSLDQEVSKLSGGNQQKVVLARWLARKPDVLILDEPTRGIDVGAKVEIYKLIHDLARQGMGIVFISSELPEVLGVSDRVIVMQNGHITGEMPARGATEEAVLRLAMADTLRQDAAS